MALDDIERCLGRLYMSDISRRDPVGVSPASVSFVRDGVKYNITVWNGGAVEDANFINQYIVIFSYLQTLILAIRVSFENKRMDKLAGRHDGEQLHHLVDDYRPLKGSRRPSKLAQKRDWRAHRSTCRLGTDGHR
ncbi:hypothetical protein SAICODRAFT_141598 [Saitoella complicata NRRL Y-17804]|uniref:uncharacterized protein n=1 Tax=Saitoella complicata (strain BCRC 22490 / CBS 7301 / JCM 7358 / NBRC 10748 / NRRL Y-17804) TaxID=698492 RepID=UPI0008677543|nr:uncharacterized protein SAICODRAFT_141598 [Saitoella complicata NRRL Y-17804]ODQ51662.1 hypothetical protein SAICODRAFT_141598 [Saitoella complicata NRRL Y-17804]